MWWNDGHRTESLNEAASGSQGDAKLSVQSWLWCGHRLRLIQKGGAPALEHDALLGHESYMYGTDEVLADNQSINKSINQSINQSIN